MDIKDLNAFRVVVEAGTVTRAALQLRRTQPAVSRMVARLEDELGFKLFERTQKRFSLTAEGDAFFRETDRLLASFDEIIEAARDIREGRLSRVRIVSMPALAHGLLPDALAAFQKSHPRISISVAGRQFDIGIASRPVDYPGVSTRRIVKARALAALPREHALARAKTVALSDLASEPLVGLGADAMIQIRINRLFVASGLGCGIVDPFTAHAVGRSDVAFRPLEPHLEFEYGLLFEKDFPQSAQITALCDEIVATAPGIMRHVHSLA